jgi:hypothetical protein
LQVVQNASLGRFIVHQCAERRFGLARIGLYQTKLLNNPTLKFNAASNILVLALDVGKALAHLAAHSYRENLSLRPRLGVHQASPGRKRLKIATIVAMIRISSSYTIRVA